VRLGPSTAIQHPQRVLLRDLVRQHEFSKKEINEFRDGGVITVAGRGGTASVTREDASCSMRGPA